MTAPVKRTTAGLILAGGRARRFGSEKALAQLGGRTLLEHNVAALAPVCVSVAVSVARDSATETRACELNLVVLHDRHEHALGPLAGVLRGLEWARDIGAAFLLTLPCDVAFVPPDALERLLRAASEDRPACASTARGAENLCAVWPLASQRILELALAEGAHPAVRDVLRALHATDVFAEGDYSFFNINTRDDLALAEATLRKS